VLAVLGGVLSTQALAMLRRSSAPESFSSQAIHLDSDSRTAMFQAQSMAPGETVRSSTQISFEGPTNMAIHLYGKTSGTGSPDALRVLVTRAGMPLFQGTLADFPDDYEHAIVDPLRPSGGGCATYRFSVTLRHLASAGTTAQEFIWEARVS
jgi:hypothetical protein